MPLDAPVFPSRFEDVNLPLRGVDDRSFKWRHPGLVGTQLGGLTIDHFHVRITPDLGWSDPDEMFTLWDQPSRTGNSRLHEFSSDSVGSAVQSSEEITYQLPQLRWESVIRPRFKRYLWRAAAVEPDGTVGAWSEIQTFELVSQIPEGSWTILPPDEPLGFVQVLKGTYDASIEAIEVLGHDPSVTFEDGMWRLEVPLSSAEQLLYVRGRNVKGETSPYLTVRVKLATTKTENFPVWNSFDEHGLILSTPRLPGEDNPTYKRRLKDVMVHRGSPRYIGLRNSITRDLGLLDEQHDRAIVLTRDIVLHPSDQVLDTLRIAHVPGKFLLLGDIFRVRGERKIVDGHDWSFVLDHPPEDLGLRISVDDRTIDFSQYRLVDGARVRFRTPAYNGRRAIVDYGYRVEIPTTGRTLAQLKADIEAVEVQGQRLLACAVQSGLESRSAEGLDFLPPVSAANFRRIDFEGVEVTGIPVRWSPVRIFSMQDPVFLELHRNEFGNHFQTRIDGWGLQLNARMQILWEHVVADKGIWFDRSMLHGHAGLVATMDLPRLFWRSTRTGRRYTTRQYVKLGGVCPYDGSRLIQEGVPVGHFRSGVSAGLDLKVRISEDAHEGTADPAPILSITRTEEDTAKEGGPEGTLDPTEIL